MTTPASSNEKPAAITPMPTRTRAGKPLLFYVPHEVCIAVTEARTDPARRYGEIADVVREIFGASARFRADDALATRFRSVGGTLRRALTQDLRPRDATLKRLQDSEIVLRDLGAGKPQGGRSRRAHDPWVALPPRKGAAAGLATTLYYYGVAVRSGHTETPEAVLLVRDLVNFINLVPAAPPEGLSENARGLLRALRAAPNWLAAATEEHQSCPSPGGTPTWVAPAKAQATGYWQFAFEGKAQAAADYGRTHPSDTVIAILDTSPTRDAVRTAAAAHPENTLLQRVYCHVHIDSSPLSVPQDAFATVDEVAVNTKDVAAQPPALRMDDHGLFIAGIIHDIAPHAETHLIRVLGGYGVSDLSTILNVLTRLPDALLCNGRTRLVVNMSLGFAIPPGVELLRLWLFETFKELVNIAGVGDRRSLREILGALKEKDAESEGALRAILDELQTGARDMEAWLGDHPEVLVVAAAGNDEGFFNSPPTAGPIRPEPRHPAYYDSVLGVAAVRADGKTPAAYSNRGDVTQLFNGIATFGGNTLPTEPGTLGKADPNDALRGLYISPTLFGSTVASGANENKTGWAYWVGTSFATPVIAALAATFWEQNQQSQRPKLIETFVTSFQTSPLEIGAKTLDCAAIGATQGFTPVAP